jgi:hypothetical protein
VFNTVDSLSEREKLFQKLNFLDITCKTKNKEEAVRLAEELKKTRYNVGTDEEIVDICKEIHYLNYSNAIEKIEKLINNDLFDVNRETR